MALNEVEIDLNNSKFTGFIDSDTGKAYLAVVLRGEDYHAEVDASNQLKTDAAGGGGGGNATHDDPAEATDTQIMLEAKDFDGSPLPNDVDTEGDAVRAGASLYGVQYIMPVSEDGSQSPYDSINNILGVGEFAPEAQQETVLTLFNAEVINDTVTRVSGVANVSEYNSKTLLVVITVSAGTPTDVDLWVEYSPDNSNWIGQNSATHGIRMINSVGGSVTVRTYTAAQEEALELPVWTKYLRVNLTGSGTDGSNTFTATVYLVGHGR